MSKIRAIKSIVEDLDTTHGRAFDLFIQAMIFVSLISFSVETLPDLSTATMNWLRIVEVVTITFFCTEYLLRLIVADRKLKFATSFFGLIDLLAILPFFLTVGVDLRSVRAFRMLRLFRVLKLVRYSRAIQRFHRALVIMWEELIIFIMLTGILLFLAAVGIYHFEHEAQPEAFASVFHSLWWAVVTLTTVGYGDAYPITFSGRMFTFIVLLVGLGIVSVPTGLIATALTEAREIEE